MAESRYKRSRRKWASGGEVASHATGRCERIRATDFRDNYNGYAILGRDDDTVIVEDVLITKNFKVFSHNGEYFTVLVSRAVHNDPDREPWAVFGFAQLELSVGAAAPQSHSTEQGVSSAWSG